MKDMGSYVEKVELSVENHCRRLEKEILKDIDMSRYVSALQAAERLLEFSEENVNMSGIALSYYYKGILCYSLNQYVNAAENLKAALPLLKQTEQYHEYTRALKMMGMIYGGMGDDNCFMEYYVEGIRSAKKYHMPEIECQLYNNIGSRYQLLEEHDTAVYYFEKALEIAQGLQEDWCQKYAAVISLNYVLSMIYRGMCEDARKIFEQSCKQMLEAGDYSDHKLAPCLVEARLNYEIGKKELVRKSLPGILNKIKAYVSQQDFEQYLKESMNLFLDMEEYEMADTVLKVFERISDAGISIFWKMKTLEYRIRLLKCTGDEKRAQSLYQAFFEYYQENQKEEQKWKVSNMKMRVQLSKEEVKRAEMQTKNRLLESRSEIDSLTGIFNRYCLEKDSEEYRKRTEGKSRCVGIIDIDYFKQLNDAYGHEAGDRCLVEVAQILLMAAGEHGTVYRYGGDEFIILMDEQPQEEISRIAENIKSMIEKARIPNCSSPVSKYVTLSQGYAMAPGTMHIERQEIFREADKSLYYIKEHGKDGFYVCKIEREE